LPPDSVKINPPIVMPTRIPPSDSARATVTPSRVLRILEQGPTLHPTAWLGGAIGKNFTDSTVPPGRPQGPEGRFLPRAHSGLGRTRPGGDGGKMIVAGDYVTVHMSFTGHFTAFRPTPGNGQPIASVPPIASRSRTAASLTIGTSRIIGRYSKDGHRKVGQ